MAGGPGGGGWLAVFAVLAVLAVLAVFAMFGVGGLGGEVGLLLCARGWGGGEGRYIKRVKGDGEADHALDTWGREKKDTNARP